MAARLTASLAAPCRARFASLPSPRSACARCTFLATRLRLGLDPIYAFADRGRARGVAVDPVHGFSAGCRMCTVGAAGGSHGEASIAAARAVAAC